jgi:hypothetical protein
LICWFALFTLPILIAITEAAQKFLFGIEAVFRIHIWIRIGSGFNQVSGSGSGFRRAKMTHKNRKKLRNFMF